MAGLGAVRDAGLPSVNGRVVSTLKKESASIPYQRTIIQYYLLRTILRMVLDR